MQEITKANDKTTIFFYLKYTNKVTEKMIEKKICKAKNINTNTNKQTNKNMFQFYAWIHEITGSNDCDDKLQEAGILTMEHFNEQIKTMQDIENKLSISKNTHFAQLLFQHINTE